MMLSAADFERLTGRLLTGTIFTDTGGFFCGEQSKQGRHGTPPSLAMLSSLALPALGSSSHSGSID